MRIELRLIRQDSVQDKENYLALQKSVALFPEMRFDDEKGIEDWSWQNCFENKNRICYIIEKIPGHLYCGECAVKNIYDDIPEIEIELMKECQNQGIGYHSMIMMLNKVAKEYGKESFYAKVEPDNYVSQILFEKLGGIPIGISKDYKISDERETLFIKEHRELLDETIQKVAEKFGVKAELLLTHVLVYRIDIKNLNKPDNCVMKPSGKIETLDYSRKISREKHIDVMREWLEDLEEIKETIKEDDNIDEKLNEMKNRILNRMEKMDAKCKIEKHL